MHSNHILRKQVRTELKRRRYVIFTLLFLSLLYIVVNLLFSDMGLFQYRELRNKEASLQKELSGIVEQNDKINASIEALKDNDFYIEKHAREEYGLAGPDEYIYIYQDKK